MSDIQLRQAIKMEFFDSKYPKHAQNQIKQIPLVIDTTTAKKQAFEDSLKKAGITAESNPSMQRAAAKSQLIKLGQEAKVTLREFTAERLQAYKEQASKRYSSPEPYGGAVTKSEISERNELRAEIEYRKM